MSKIKRRKPKKSRYQNKKKKELISKKMLWTFIIGILMVASVFGIMFSSYADEKVDSAYGDLRFTRSKTGWTLDLGDRSMEFHFLPEDVDMLNISEEVLDVIGNASIMYITFNPNVKYIERFELMRFELEEVFRENGKFVMQGISESNDLYKAPMISCGNATTTLPVISIEFSNETAAFVEDNCVKLNVDEFTALPMKDALVYRLLGIIKDND